jgi:hypothetical protein
VDRERQGLAVHAGREGYEHAGHGPQCTPPARTMGLRDGRWTEVCRAPVRWGRGHAASENSVQAKFRDGAQKRADAPS